jgi:hypothetical protein
MHVARWLLCALFAVPVPAVATPFVIDDVNGGAAPRASAIWGVNDVGWVYTPGFGYDLIGVNTKFLDYSMFPDGQVVGLEVYDAAPIAGGTLLRSAPFAAHGGVFVGALFAPLALVAGQDYFIGFRNVLFLGGNETGDPFAATLPFYASIVGSGTYESTLIGCGCSAPILQFVAEDATSVPEPATLILLGIWAVAVLTKVQPSKSCNPEIFDNS